MLNASVNSSAHVGFKKINSAGNISAPKVILHLEGLVLLATTIVFYARLDFAWSLFWLLLLSPDLSLVPYLINRNWGTHVYNVMHTLALPAMLIAYAFATDWTIGIQLALIWLAHIGMDRSVGYGLKYNDSFGDTHLRKV